MEISTTRFGKLEIDAADIVVFPGGMLGLADCLRWVLLADRQGDALGWLQSVDHPQIALAVVSPRRFVPGYEVRVARGELQPLALDSLQDAHVLVTVSKHEEAITLNLKAPLIINMERRLGRQAITNGDQPIQYPLMTDSTPRKRIA
jgi:flagellar assembly factor FliW